VTDQAQLVAAVAALWTSACTLAGLIYRIEEARIAEWRERCAFLEADARNAVEAKDEEIQQWRVLLQRTLHHSGSSESGT
jgi:hypothetical protein